MAENNFEDTFYIQSDLLKQVEPLMVEYFDYDSSMLIDVIDQTVEEQCKLKDYMCIDEEGIITIDLAKHFYKTDGLTFTDELYTHQNGVNKASTYKDLCDKFPQYFQIEKNEYLVEHYDIYLVLSYMSYIYFRQKNDDFNMKTNRFAQDADLMYQYTLNQKIYPEILSLYRMILESKKKYKRQGDTITINYKQETHKINFGGWFIADMEKYFNERFPDLTLEKINELLPKPSKGGRKSQDPYIMIMIWGTYQLMKNHHSTFKDSKIAISTEMCQFILDYLKFCNIDTDRFVDTSIKDHLKNMIRRGYKPIWNLPWRNVISDIQEKQPKSEFERLTQPLRRYNL